MPSTLQSLLADPSRLAQASQAQGQKYQPVVRTPMPKASTLAELVGLSQLLAPAQGLAHQIETQGLARGGKAHRYPRDLRDLPDLSERGLYPGSYDLHVASRVPVQDYYLGSNEFLDPLTLNYEYTGKTLYPRSREDELPEPADKARGGRVPTVKHFWGGGDSDEGDDAAGGWGGDPTGGFASDPGAADPSNTGFGDSWGGDAGYADDRGGGGMDWGDYADSYNPDALAGLSGMDWGSADTYSDALSGQFGTESLLGGPVTDELTALAGPPQREKSPEELAAEEMATAPRDIDRAIEITVGGPATTEDPAASVYGTKEEAPQTSNVAIGTGTIGSTPGAGSFGLSGPTGAAPAGIHTDDTSLTSQDAFNAAQAMADPASGLIGNPNVAEALGSMPGVAGLENTNVPGFAGPAGMNYGDGFEGISAMAERADRPGFASSAATRDLGYLDTREKALTESMRQQIEDYGVTHGLNLTPQGVAGLIGQFKHESLLNPAALGYADPTNFGAIGLAQNRGKRAEGLLNEIGVDPELGRAAAQNRPGARSALADALSGTMNLQVSRAMDEMFDPDHPSYVGAPAGRTMQSPGLSVADVGRMLGVQFEGEPHHGAQRSAQAREAIGHMAATDRASAANLASMGTPGAYATVSPGYTPSPDGFTGLRGLGGLTDVASLDPGVMAYAGDALASASPASANPVSQRSPAWEGDIGPDDNPFTAEEKANWVGEKGRSASRSAASSASPASANTQLAGAAGTTAMGGPTEDMLTDAPAELTAGTTIGNRVTMDPITREKMDPYGNKVLGDPDKLFGVAANLLGSALVPGYGPLNALSNLMTGTGIAQNAMRAFDVHGVPSYEPNTYGAAGNIGSLAGLGSPSQAAKGPTESPVTPATTPATTTVAPPGYTPRTFATVADPSRYGYGRSHQFFS
jgi:hypothetical protein